MQVEALQRRNQELISELSKANSVGDQQELIQLRGQKEKLQQEVQYLTGQLMQRKNCPDTREVRLGRRWVIRPRIYQLWADVLKLAIKQNLVSVSFGSAGDVSH